MESSKVISKKKTCPGVGLALVSPTARFHADWEEFNLALKTPKFNMNKSENISVRTMSLTVCELFPRENEAWRC